MQQEGYDHANMLTTQLRADLDTRNAQMLALVQQYTDTDEQKEDEDPPDKPSANALTHNTIKLKMLRVLQKIQQDMSRDSTNCRNRTKKNSNQGGRVNARRGGKKDSRRRHFKTPYHQKILLDTRWMQSRFCRMSQDSTWT